MNKVAPVTDVASNIKPVFVVGMNGSGTTMLLDSLGRHPELYAFPRETRLIPYLYANRNKYGNLRNDDNFRRLWHEVMRIPAFLHANGMEEMPLPKDWRAHARSLAGVLDGVFQYFSKQEGKHRWCEKTPQHVQHIAVLAKIFPGASFVHMVRDGRDCAASFNRRWRRTPELTIYRWKRVVLEGRRQGAELGNERYLEIRYEDLTQAPRKWLGTICDFLQVEFDERILESSQPYLKKASVEDNADGNEGIVPNSGNWNRYFSARRLERLEKISGLTLREFGYETAATAGDVNPDRYQLRIWSVRDFFVQFAREIGLKLSGKIERPWSMILSRPLVALRQRKMNKY